MTVHKVNAGCELASKEVSSSLQLLVVADNHTVVPSGR